MINIILSGCNGKMGKFISSVISDRDDCKVVAGIDINTQANDGFPVFAQPDEYKGEADVIIDFSHPSSLEKLLKYAKANNLPIVIATTGLSDEQKKDLAEAAKTVPVFFSANMSIGVSLIAELAKTAARILGQGFDIEIIEKHHNQKIDAPSGTALMLADAVSGVMPEEMNYEYNRQAKRSKRTKNEIGIHAVRGGTIVGEHDVIFAGRDEVITISHSAASKEVFAVGAVNAALFLVNKEPKLYSMKDFVSF